MSDGMDLDFHRDIDPNTVYELTALLGEGSYGAVYRAKPRAVLASHKEVAIKIIPDADDDLTALWREIRFLQVLRSPFVVSFVESFLFDNELWLAMELCDGGSLYDLKEAQKGAFKESELQTIMAFCVMGLAHLHAQMSIHRDVKSGNVLLTRDGRAKLADFGISAQLTDTIMKRRTVIGSPYWMAPEVIQETSYDGKADIWSLGITLIELCEGSPPHFNVHPMRAIFIISSKPAPTLKEQDRWSKDLNDFLGQCLVKDCDKRSSAADLLKHPWIHKAAKDIGSTGRSSPILAELVNTNWDEIEKIRVARFKLPENIPIGGEGHVVDRECSPVDEDNTATMRIRTASSSSGIPTTRQQLRNLTLTRSMTSNRYREPSNVEQEDFSHTLVRRPLPPVHGQEGTIRIAPTSIAPSSSPSTFADHKNAVSDRVQSKGGYHAASAGNDGTFVRLEPRGHSSDFDRDGTMVRASNIVGSKVSEQDEDYVDNNGTFTRRRSGSGAKNPDRNDLQAALRYFREESNSSVASSVPTVNITPSKVPVKPIAAEPKGKSEALRIAAKDLRGHEDEEIYRTYDSKEVVLSPSNRIDSELDVLNTLTNSAGDSDPMKELLKKDILRRMSILKKQYRDDLERLTKTYEARRKTLKDALLTFSAEFDSHTVGRKDKATLSANKPDRKSGP